MIDLRAGADRSPRPPHPANAAKTKSNDATRSMTWGPGLQLTKKCAAESLPGADLTRQLYVRVRLTRAFGPQPSKERMFRRKPAESRRRGLVSGAMFAALFVAASGVARAQDLSCGKGDVEVRSLNFEGNKAISDDELAQRVYTTPSAAFRRNLHVALGAKRCLNRAYLRRDIAAIELFYLERGYYSAKADTVISKLGRDAVRVTFRVNEGPVTVLDSLTVSGLNGVPDSASIIRSLRVKPGDPFSIALYMA